MECPREDRQIKKAVGGDGNKGETDFDLKNGTIFLLDNGKSHI